VLLARKEIDINQAAKDGFTPLYAACMSGHVGVARLLLTKKEIQINRANDFGATPLYAACTYGHVDVVRLLLASEEIDINKEVHGFTPLQFAQAGGYTEIVALLQHAHQEL